MERANIIQARHDEETMSLAKRQVGHGCFTLVAGAAHIFAAQSDLAGRASNGMCFVQGLVHLRVPRTLQAR